MIKQRLHVKKLLKKFLNSIKLVLLFSTEIFSTEYRDVQYRVPRCQVPSTEMSSTEYRDVAYVQYRDVLIPWKRSQNDPQCVIAELYIQESFVILSLKYIMVFLWFSSSCDLNYCLDIRLHIDYLSATSGLRYFSTRDFRI